ncbi:hypothetical protein ACLOAV_010407 [Pseudogymnoascus australis]
MGKSTWIDIRASLDDLVLQEHHQPYELLSTITNPNAQTPQMILMVGAGHKTVAIQKLRSGIPRTSHYGGDIHLSVDPQTISWQSPVLFADCELHTAKSFKTVVAGRVSGNIARRSLTWRRRMPQGLSVEPGDVSNLVYTQLMLPFSTLICLFADDLEGLEGVARLLAAWLVNLVNCPSDLPRNTHPRIVILRRVSNSAPIDELALMCRFLSMLIREAERRVGPVVERRQGVIDTSMLFFYFGDIRILTLPETHSTLQQWEYLRTRILAESECVFTKRLEAKFAFSATHFKQLFSFACDHFCTDVLAPFNFIRATRRASPVPGNMAVHLSEFISQVNSERLNTFAIRLHTFAVPAIASALVLDAFPPEMHDVFNELYKHICLGIYNPRRSKNTNEEAFDSIQLTNSIEHQFCQTATSIAHGKTTAVAAHQSSLCNSRETWASLRSTKTCFSCLARQPEHVCSSRCRHAICDTCLVIHGESTPNSPWTITLKTCPLCCIGVRKIIRRKPPTAGVRAIIADGRGLRGASWLIDKLKELKSALNLDTPILDHFDLSVGSDFGKPMQYDGKTC